MAKFPTREEKVRVRSRRKKHLTVKQKVMKRERKEFRKVSGTEGSGKKFKYGLLFRIESFMILLLLVVFGGMIRHYSEYEEEYQYLEQTGDVIEFDESMWDDLESGLYQEKVSGLGSIGVVGIKSTFDLLDFYVGFVTDFFEFLMDFNPFEWVRKVGRWFGV